MGALNKLSMIFALPAEDRNTKIKYVAIRTTKNLIDTLLHSSIILLLNHNWGNIVHMDRINSYRIFSNFPKYKRLFNDSIVCFYIIYHTAQCLLIKLARPYCRRFYPFDIFAGFDRPDLFGIDHSRSPQFMDQKA